MAQTPEGKVKDKARKMLKEYDIWHFAPVSNGMGTMGIPDMIACMRGQFLAIECKADAKKKPTQLQLHQLDQIAKHGGLSIVIHDENLHELEYLITKFLLDLE